MKAVRLQVRDVFVSVTVNVNAKGGRAMVEPVEARGRKSLCSLVDLQDWDAAQRRYEELGVMIRYVNGRQPCVNVEEVREASRRWHGLKKKRTPP